MDEAHYLLPASSKEAARSVSGRLPAVIYITVNPHALACQVLQTIDVVLAFPDASEVIERFAKAIGLAVPAPIAKLERSEIRAWSLRSNQPPSVVQIERPKQSHRRHVRKYATGDVGERQSLYFRANGDLPGRQARNLLEFITISEELDDSL